MTSSSISYYFFPTPNIHFHKRTTTESSSIPSPKHRTCRRRKNHLRPKIPTKPQTQNQDQIQAQLVFCLEEATELVQEERLVESESFDPVLASGQGWLPGSEILGLALRFAALLAVQTAVALLIFGRGKADEDVAPAVGEEAGEEARARVPERKWESEEVVEEIREMVKEAREREAEEADEEGGGIRGEIRREIPRLTKSLAKDIMDKKESSLAPKGRVSTRRKRVGLVKLNTRIRDAPKGFNGSKNREEDITIVDADSYQNPVKESQNLYESRGSSAVNSKLVENVSDVDDYSVLPFGSSSYADELHISTQRKVEESNSDHIMTSLVNNYPKQSGMKIEKSFKEGTSVIPTYMNGKSESGKDGEEKKSNFQKREDYNSIPRNEPWWMKLPFVLAILLHRGSDRNGPKGLYSLKMESPSEDGGSTHYTIVFQDQSDATNFCYLLESFFEDLDDFSADVVPLAIHELEERVRSSEMKVIVVRKGRVQLYAGQPLAEVETLLRTLID